MESLLIPKSEHDDSVDGIQRKKRKISLAICTTCGTEEARYRCPGCLKHSCSLSCVKAHKLQSGCSGVRDKTAFVPLSKFDEMNLLSDLRFLEDTSRLADSTHRDPLILRPRTTSSAKKMIKSAPKFNLQLKLLPPGFSRRCENTTFFNNKLKQFHWHLKLQFPQSNAVFTERRVPDDRTLEQILSRYISPTKSDPIRRQRLKAYALAPPDLVKVFMKAENRRGSVARYHELDLQKSLRENLRFKVVVEYPEFHVTLRDHCQNYALVTEESRAGRPWVAMATRPPCADRWNATTCHATAVVAPPPRSVGADGVVSAAGVSTSAGRVSVAGDDELEDGEIRDDEEELCSAATPNQPNMPNESNVSPPDAAVITAAEGTD